jgi:hypothetical protein
MPLATCPECHRHVKTTEGACPFCRASLPEDLAHRVQNRPVNRNRFGRAAFVSFGAALATSVVACASDDEDPGDGRQQQTKGGAGGTGGDAADAGTGGKATGGTAGATVGGAAGAGGIVSQPVYGIPIDDPDPNIGQPEYGVPIDFDAGAPDANNPVDGGGEQNATPVYGIPVDDAEP